MIAYAAGAIALALYEAAVSSSASAGRVGAVLGWPAKVLAWLVDPTVPGIPDLSGAKTSAATSGSTTPKVSVPGAILT